MMSIGMLWNFKILPYLCFEICEFIPRDVYILMHTICIDVHLSVNGLWQNCLCTLPTAFVLWYNWHLASTVLNPVLFGILQSAKQHRLWFFFACQTKLQHTLSLLVAGAVCFVLFFFRFCFFFHTVILPVAVAPLLVAVAAVACDCVFVFRLKETHKIMERAHQNAFCLKMP